MVIGLSVTYQKPSLYLKNTIDKGNKVKYCFIYSLKNNTKCIMHKMYFILKYIFKNSDLIFHKQLGGY